MKRDGDTGAPRGGMPCLAQGRRSENERASVVAREGERDEGLAKPDVIREYGPSMCGEKVPVALYAMQLMRVEGELAQCRIVLGDTQHMSRHRGAHHVGRSCVHQGTISAAQSPRRNPKTSSTAMCSRASARSSDSVRAAS